jgi:hypothetical protein
MPPLTALERIRREVRFADEARRGVIKTANRQRLSARHPERVSFHPAQLAIRHQALSGAKPAGPAPCGPIVLLVASGRG